MNQRDRTRLEALVWKNKHTDFKGKRADGTKCVLHLYPERGTCSVPLASLTDAELLAKLPTHVRDLFEAGVEWRRLIALAGQP